MDNWISNAIAEKFLLKASAIIMGSVKDALLSLMAFGDLWFDVFQWNHLLFPSKYFLGL